MFYGVIMLCEYLGGNALVVPSLAAWAAALRLRDGRLLAVGPDSDVNGSSRFQAEGRLISGPL